MRYTSFQQICTQTFPSSSRSKDWILLSLQPHLPNRQSGELDEAHGGPASCRLQTLYNTVTFHWAKKPQPLIISYYYFYQKSCFSIECSCNLVCRGEKLFDYEILMTFSLLFWIDVKQKYFEFFFFISFLKH